MSNTVHVHGREWLVVHGPMELGNDETLGYLVVECHPNGRTKLPADVKYVEVSRGNNEG